MSFEYYHQIHDIVYPLMWFQRPEAAMTFATDNGIYFFYQRGETYEYHGKIYDRIVRVGINTHEGNFRKRLRTHYQPRGASIFRNHIEDALINERPEWYQMGKTRTLEAVTAYLKDEFWFRLISLPSAKEGADWERKIIQTIAPYSYQFSSDHWLGHRAKKGVQSFGLWNIQHTKKFDDEFTDRDMRTFRRVVNKDYARQELIDRQVG